MSDEAVMSPRLSQSLDLFRQLAIDQTIKHRHYIAGMDSQYRDEVFQDLSERVDQYFAILEKEVP